MVTVKQFSTTIVAGSIMFPKSGALSSATALLRRRLPPLKELRLDEEVATYTSSPALPPSSSWPLQTRCGNPVGAALHLQNYTVSWVSLFSLHTVGTLALF